MEKIKLVRIDSRLSHGKTVENWCKEYGLSRVIIANEKVANDDFAKEIMNLTIPEEVKAYYISPKKVKEFIKKNPDKYFVIVDKTKDLDILIKDGIEIENINIGIIHMQKGKKSLTEEVAVDQEDLEIFKNLVDMGINLSIRPSPYSSKRNLEDFLSK